MRTRSWLLALTLTLAVSPPAHAEWFVTPFVGGQFGGAARDPLFPGAMSALEPWTVGASGGWTGGGWFGFEADFGLAPKFFDDDGGFVTETSVLTLMGNARFAVPLGGMGGSVRPFVSGGVGIVRPNVAEAGGLAAVSGNKFGWNVGGGATGFFNDHAGLSGEVRYFRTMAGDDEPPNAFDIDFDAFDFWRASVGVTFKW
jgi:opacity protein-like surface antigen